jgi:hypothetical protein
MRTRSIVLIFVTFIVMCGLVPAAFAQSPSNSQFEAAGTDPARVQAFLASLQEALEVENQLRVASLVKYPLEAWVDGQTIKIRSNGELVTHYRKIFDASMRRSIAGARVDAMGVSADGVMIDGGRLCLKAGDKGRGLKIVKIGEPVAVR